MKDLERCNLRESYVLPQSCAMERDKRISPKNNFTDVVDSNILFILIIHDQIINHQHHHIIFIMLTHDINSTLIYIQHTSRVNKHTTTTSKIIVVRLLFNQLWSTHTSTYVLCIPYSSTPSMVSSSSSSSSSSSPIIMHTHDKGG